MTYGVPPQLPGDRQQGVPLHAKPVPPAGKKHLKKLKAEHQEKINAVSREILGIVKKAFQCIQMHTGKIRLLIKKFMKHPTGQRFRKLMKTIEERVFGKKNAPQRNVEAPVLINLKAEMAKAGDRVEKFGQALRDLEGFQEEKAAAQDDIALTVKISKVSPKLPIPQQEELIGLANQAFGQEIVSLRDFKNLIHKEAGIAISQKTAEDASQCEKAAALIKKELEAYAPPQEVTLETLSAAYLTTLTKIKQAFIDNGLYSENDGDVEQILKLQAYLLSDLPGSQALDLFVNQQGIHLEDFELTFDLESMHGVLAYHDFMNKYPLGISLHKQLRQIFLEFSLGNLV
jgi:hypothetical protein